MYTVPFMTTAVVGDKERGCCPGNSHVGIANILDNGTSIPVVREYLVMATFLA